MDGRKIRAAAIQMSSTPDKEENKATAEALSREAVTAGADLVALPELWSCHGLDEVYRENAEPVPGPMTEFMGDLARELGVYLLGGSILEGEPGSERLSNTSTFFDPSGEMTAVYRKIHLFDVKVSEREYLESANIAPGTEIVTAKRALPPWGSRSATMCASPNSIGSSLCAERRSWRSRQRSPCRRARTTGSSCSGCGPSRTRRSSS